MALVSSNETLQVRGTFDVSSGTLTLKDDQVARAKLTQEALVAQAIPLCDARVFDATTSHLPATAAADDLGLIDNTYGTGALTLQTSDAQGTSVTQKARFQIPITESYDEGESLTLRIRHGMVTTVADASSTVDVQCFVPDGDGSIGSDICETGAIASNSLTKADRDFVITPTSVVIGDILDIVITLYVEHAAATVCKGEISSIKLLRDVKG